MSRTIALLALATQSWLLQTVPLQIGDAAPPLTLREFVAGEPISQLTKGTVYVIVNEFFGKTCGSIFFVRMGYGDLNKAMGFILGGIMQAIEIDIEYQRRVDAMSIREKVERSVAMLAWTRQQIAARIRKHLPVLTDEQLKWHVALKLYESEPGVVEMIQGCLSDVFGGSFLAHRRAIRFGLYATRDSVPHHWRFDQFCLR